MALSDHIAELEELVTRGVANAPAALASLQTIISRGQTIAAAITDYQKKRTDVVAIPFFEVLATADLIDAFIDTYFDDLDYSPDLFLDLRSAEEGLFSLQTLRLAFASQAGPNAGFSDAFVPGPAPLPSYTIRQGDTLERIALNYLGSVDRVDDIIDLNDLVYPFLVADRSVFYPAEFSTEFDPTEFQTADFVGPPALPPGVLGVGDTLLLPADATITGGGAIVTKDEIDVELYGRDLQLHDGFLVRDGSGNLLTVQGIENIKQALTERYATLAGELVLHPSYGVERLLAVGIEGTRANVILSGMSIVRATLQDPRVLSVSNVDIFFKRTVNTIGLTAVLIGLAQRTLPLNLVLPESLQMKAAG